MLTCYQDLKRNCEEYIKIYKTKIYNLYKECIIEDLIEMVPIYEKLKKEIEENQDLASLNEESIFMNYLNEIQESKFVKHDNFTTIHEEIF